MPLLLVRNDITKMKVDAIVNAANKSLLGGGGVDGAIHRAAGPALLAECLRLGGCQTGQAKLTGAGRLPCRYVIHTVGPVWRGGGHGEAALLQSCYTASLRLAVEKGCDSVAFPLISSGVYGYPKQAALQLAVQAITDFLQQQELTVYLVIFDRSTYEIGRGLYDEIAAYIDDRYVAAHTDPDEARRRRLANARPLAQADGEVPDAAGDLWSDVADGFPDSAPFAAPMAAPAPPAAPAAKGKRKGATPSAKGKAKGVTLLEEVKVKGVAPLEQAGEAAKGAAPLPQAASVPPPQAAWGQTALQSIAAAPGSLEEALRRMDESFSEMLLRTIDEKGMTDAQCYKKANIDRKLFSKIRSDRFYRPSKPTVLAFAVALELSLAQTREMLQKAGFALSHSNKADIIVEFFIQRGNYNVFEINEALFAFDQSLLGG